MAPAPVLPSRKRRDARASGGGVVCEGWGGRRDDGTVRACAPACPRLRLSLLQTESACICRVDSSNAGPSGKNQLLREAAIDMVRARQKDLARAEATWRKLEDELAQVPRACPCPICPGTANQRVCLVRVCRGRTPSTCAVCFHHLSRA